MTAVKIAPAMSPRIGLENIVRIPVNFSLSARGATAPLMVSIPVIRIANPMRIIPISFFLSSFVNMIKMTPITARIGENEDGFNKVRKKLPPLMPVRLSNQEVIVVPTLAPIIIPIAWDNFMIPELTNPTTITVVAEED